MELKFKTTECVNPENNRTRTEQYQSLLTQKYYQSSHKFQFRHSDHEYSWHTLKKTLVDLCHLDLVDRDLDLVDPDLVHARDPFQFAVELLTL